MIQCVGPAERTCARICCSVTLKNALRWKELNPEGELTVLFRDMRTYGFKERLYRDALERGIRFIRYDEAHRPAPEIRGAASPLLVHAWDLSLGIALDLPADLLVLSMPVVPATGSRELARTLKVPVDQDGWFLEAHVKLRPVEFASEGLFLAGAAHYPKLLDEAACVGCLTCVRICPFGVPQVTAGAVGVGAVVGAAYIEPTICQGCGICVGECPANAIELLHYRRGQVERQVLSLLEAEVGG